MENPKGLIASGIWLFAIVRKSRIRLCSHASIALLCLLLSPSWAGAGNVDVQMDAPLATTTAELSKLIQEYRDVYFKKNASEPGGLLRDPAAYAKWVDLRWRISRTLDEKKTLGDLRDLGFTPRENGTYVLRLSEHPYWMPIVDELLTLRAPGAYDAIEEDLKSRGFTAVNLAQFKNYTDSIHPDSAAVAASRSLTEALAQKVRSQRDANLPIDNEELTKFMYSRMRSVEEAHRAWAEGLLNALDPTSQRALMSHIADRDGFVVFGPGSDVNKQRETLIHWIVSGKYAATLDREAMEARK